MRFSPVVYAGLLSLVPTALGIPRFNANDIKRASDNVKEMQNGQTGRVVVFPEPVDTGLKQIPDAAHPFQAPGPNDMRGPCPALNTLANHGYIPRNGIAQPEQILAAVMEAFNMGHDFGSFIVSFATLARGNPYIGLLSIGHESNQIPTLPGNIDGSAPPGGIAKHNRFEGDVSSTRRDAHVGDNVNFQDDLFDTLLTYVGKYGDDGPDGPQSIVNLKAFQEFKFDAFNRDQALDADLQFHPARQLTTYSEVAFILDLFANGTDGTLSIQGLGSIFRNQTFAPNWFRRSTPAELPTISGTAGMVLAAHPIPPGANVNGKYVPDVLNNDSFLCHGYEDIMTGQVPHTYNNVTGIFKQNVDTFINAIYKPFHDFANCTFTSPILPAGPTGI